MIHSDFGLMPGRNIHVPVIGELMVRVESSQSEEAAWLSSEPVFQPSCRGA